MTVDEKIINSFEWTIWIKIKKILIKKVGKNVTLIKIEV